MRTLTEKEAEDFLEKDGFMVAKRAHTKNKSELEKIKIPFPWAIKISSSKIAHKSRIGGIILNVQNINEAEKAFDKLSEIANFEEVLVQEMIVGEELIIGIKKTPEFGHVIMFGKGGSRVEEEKDVAFRIPHLTIKDAEDLIKEIKFYRIIEQKKLNKKLIVKMILKTSELVEKYPSISELDINPLIVSSEKAEIADARIVFE